MPISFTLDNVMERVLREDTPDDSCSCRCASVKHEAQTAWHRVLEHKWYSSERLRRDVGFRVAAVDFFDNIYSRGAKNSGSCLTNWIRRVPCAMQNLA